MDRFYPFFLLTLLPFLIPLPVFSQELPVKQIPEVTVVKGNQKFFSDDQTIYKVDLELIRLDRHQNLGYFLEKQTPALVRSYGSAGSLVSVSLHGAGSNHTQVNWNGFPLNSPTTGQADLALIPAGFMQTVELMNGSSGALFGSGTFGGSINLSNEPDWNNRFAAHYSFDAGSFGSNGHMLSVRTGGEKLQFQLSAISAKAENDFTYRDRYRYGSPEVKTQHNAYRSVGLIHNIYLNLNKGSYLEAGMWYQRKILEIPALMGSYKESNARQKDSIFRSYMSYRKITAKSALLVRSAYFSDYLGYTDKNLTTDTSYSIDSRIATTRWMNEADYRYYLSSKLIVGGGAMYNRLSGNSGNYGGRITEHEYAVFGSLKVSLSDLIINAGVRKEFYEGLNPGIQYSLGLRFRPNEHWILRSGFSSKFRKPTFNEKYWRPGGNSLLRPEKGRGGEITAEWSSKGDQERSLWLEAQITGYYQWIDNWIQWVIRDSLTPVEYKKVHARGIDTRMELGYHLNEFAIKAFVNYDYNRSVIISTYDNNPLCEGNQMTYVPVHTAGAGLEAVYHGFLLGISSSYTGYRETVETADETLRLPGFYLMNMVTGIRREILGADLAFFFRIDNITDRSYEVIRSFPLPGRNYHFTLTIGLQKITSDN
ncbi:MAG: TonB-dependent receptor plug domain-containing protein [Bacteroidales bacterium]|nr:TonB-dependent receptor plug domain-containing protein [Bacteroidales bacterium]